MKLWSVLPAVALLAACSASDEGADTPAPAGMATPIETGFDSDNLASSPACFAEDRSAGLMPGQSLVERSPDGAVRISHALNGEQENFVFLITELTDEERATIDGAAADFIRAAGQSYDVTTDAVIYHRSTDGTFCTVVKDVDAGTAVVDAARTVHAARES